MAAVAELAVRHLQLRAELSAGVGPVVDSAGREYEPNLAEWHLAGLPLGDDEWQLNGHVLLRGTVLAQRDAISVTGVFSWPAEIRPMVLSPWSQSPPLPANVPWPRAWIRSSVELLTGMRVSGGGL